MSTDDVQIRRMRSEDVPLVLEVADGLMEAPRWTRESYLSAADPEASPARISLVAEDPEAGVTGFLVTLLIPPQAELETIAVARHAQRRGIAARLFTELLRILKEQQITEVMLEVRESNHSARAFYRSLGFSETGRRAGYYTDPKEDAVLLQRSVE